MSSHTLHHPFYQRNAWILLFIVSILLAVSNLSVIFVAGMNANDFEGSTGIGIEELPPDVATYFLRLTRLTGAGFLGFTLFALTLTIFSFRNGYRWAWYAMWILPAVLAAAAGIFFLHGAQSIGWYYGSISALAVIGLLASFRRFFPNRKYDQR